MGPGRASLPSPVSLLDVEERTVRRCSECAKRPIYRGRGTGRATPVSLLVDVPVWKVRHVSEREYPDIQNPLKDTRLANDY